MLVLIMSIIYQKLFQFHNSILYHTGRLSVFIGKRKYCTSSYMLDICVIIICIDRIMRLFCGEFKYVNLFTQLTVFQVDHSY